ncbi:hypothetical protein [Streptodolium elevatio]|uniref:Uncharacterized protein n=1 Tax=Streptodolium elevatio TaxID=3157996 RepID=A0ABV3DNK9_9ACTN
MHTLDTTAPITAGPAIAVQDPRESYGDTAVLDGIDIAVPEGTVLIVLLLN